MAEQVVYSPNTYTGKLYGDIVTPALMAPDGLIELGLVTPVPGLKGRMILRDIDSNVEFQDPSCIFNPQDGDITNGEKYLDPVAYSVMREICYDDVKGSWDTSKLKAGALNDYKPPRDLEQAIIQRMEEKVAIMNEQLYLLGKGGVTAGDVTVTAAYPGLFGRFRASSAVKKVATGDVGVANVSKLAFSAISIANPGVVTVASTANLRTGDTVTIIGTTGTPQVGGKSINGQEFQITVLSGTTFSLNATVTGTTSAGTVVFVNETNVLEILLAALAFLPKTVKKQSDFNVPVSPHIIEAYAIAQARVANGAGSYFIGEKSLDILGRQLKPLEYAPANTIGGWRASNVFLGYDDGSDAVNLRITDLSKTTGDEAFRYKLQMQTDINFRFGNEIFLMTPIIA